MPLVLFNLAPEIRMGKALLETFSGERLPSRKKQRDACQSPWFWGLAGGWESPQQEFCAWTVIWGASPPVTLGLASKLNYIHISRAQFIESYGGNHWLPLKTWLGGWPPATKWSLKIKYLFLNPRRQYLSIKVRNKWLFFPSGNSWIVSHWNMTVPLSHTACRNQFRWRRRNAPCRGLVGCLGSESSLQGLTSINLVVCYSGI